MNSERSRALVVLGSLFLLSFVGLGGVHIAQAGESQTAVWTKQAQVAAAHQQPQQAIRLLQRTRQHEALSTEAQLLMAESLLRLNRLDEAQREAEQLEKSAPDRAEVQELLGDLNARQQDWGRAKQHYTRAVAAQPQNADLHLRLGQALQSLGDNTAADQSFARYQALTSASSPKPTR